MATETTQFERAPREDPREVAQETAEGTIDLDGNGDGSITVSLTGDLSTAGLGLLAEATADDGTASVSNVTATSVDVSISGGTASTTASFELVVSEDGFAV